MADEREHLHTRDFSKNMLPPAAAVPQGDAAQAHIDMAGCGHQLFLSVDVVPESPLGRMTARARGSIYCAL